MQTITELIKELKKDGKLNHDDIVRLHSKIDEIGVSYEVANILFDLKNSINEEKVTNDFEELFVAVISKLLLDDENSPGEIDEDEAKWLRGKIQMNGYLDHYDLALLERLKDRSINFPQILNFKGRVARKFEGALYFSRFLTLMAVFGSLISAIVLFIKGGVIVCDAITESMKDFTNPEYEKLLESLVSSVDVFLFAMVLVIFGVGIYELFISKIDPVEQKVGGRPTWMQVTNIDELKSSLGKVILMVLIVTFFKHSIEVEYGNVNDLLKLGVGIVLIALSLFITSKAKH